MGEAAEVRDKQSVCRRGDARGAQGLCPALEVGAGRSRREFSSWQAAAPAGFPPAGPRLPRPGEWGSGAMGSVTAGRALAGSPVSHTWVWWVSQGMKTPVALKKLLEAGVRKGKGLPAVLCSPVSAFTLC